MSLVPSAKKIHAAVSIVLSLLMGGCELSQPRTSTTRLIPVNSLMQQWTFDLNLNKRNDSIRGLYLRDNTLFVYSKRNLVSVFNADSGKALWSKPITEDQVPLKPPVLVSDKYAFPAGSSIEVYAKDGRKADSLDTERSIRSGGAGMGNTIYIGLDYPGGGRLAAIDLTRRFDRARWEFQVRTGVSAAPATYQGIIYFASEAGAVYALSEDKAPAWPLDRSAFETDGRIVADVQADEGGVYVASFDTKLYCLENGTGRLRWQYYAGVPLNESPVVTKDTVYLVVPHVGVAAIDKTQGKSNRDAKWLVKGATRFLSQDEKYVYLRGAGNYIIAVDRGSGEMKFRSKRNDFAAFAINTRTDIIYAATRDGSIVAIKPVLTPGTTGSLVRSSSGFQEIALAPAR